MKNSSQPVCDQLIPLQRMIEDRSAIIGVVGLGYVGLPLLRAFWEAGFRVIGFDTDDEKITHLNDGTCYLNHFGERFVADMTDSDRFEAASDSSRYSEPAALLLCVPTPLDREHNPDLSYIRDTVDAVAAQLRPGQLVCLESTTYPGTTREVVLPRLEASDLRCGHDYFLAYSPERQDPGRASHTTATIPKLVGGIDVRSTTAAATLYRAAVDQVTTVSSPEVAEAAKLLENIYRAVNIALVNEMKLVLTKMGIDIWEVIEAASTKPFGFHPFYPGPGLGGHCIPIDPFYFSWKARQVGMATRFIELAGEVNHAIPQYVVQRTVEALAKRGTAIRGARILVLGLAYKPDVDDVRESPSFELIEQLRAQGAEVDYNDPHVPKTHKMRHHDLRMRSVELSPQALDHYDCVLVATHHTCYDWSLIAEHAKLIVDTRNALSGVEGSRDHIVSA